MYNFPGLRLPLQSIVVLKPCFSTDILRDEKETQLTIDDIVVDLEET